MLPPLRVGARLNVGVCHNHKPLVTVMGATTMTTLEITCAASAWKLSAHFRGIHSSCANCSSLSLPPNA